MTTMPVPAESGPIADYHDRERWLRERKTGIGGSEIAAIFNKHPYLTPRQLWERKTGRAGEQDVTPFMERGRVLEPVAAELYAEKTGRKVRRMALRRHPEHPFLLASVDRQIIAGTGKDEWLTDETAACELKVLGWRSFARIRKEGLPEYIVLQGEMESLVTGYPFTSFGILHPDSWRFLPFDVEADAGLQEMIINEAGEWWEQFVVQDVPPPEPDPERDLGLPKIEGEFVRMDGNEEWRKAAADFREAKEMLDTAAAFEKDARERLKSLMPGVGAAEGAGVRCYLAEMDGRRQYAQEIKAIEAVKPLDPEKVQGILSTVLSSDPEWARTLIAELAEYARLDLSQFEKYGAAFERFTPYILKTEED